MSLDLPCNINCADERALGALILAAGFGSRLRSLFESKPLASVCGVSLIEIAIRQAVSAGADNVVVVTGHHAEAVEAALPAISEKAGVPVSACRLEVWDRPNGFSVMAGASRFSANYLLMMADHILSASILRDLADQRTGDRDVTLAIDRRTDSPLIDPDDATWVSTASNGFIKAIGKHIERRDAVDCGAFLATPRLAGAIAEAVSLGRPGSLSDGMQVLADKGRAATMEIGEAWWMDVDDPRAHALACAQAPGNLGDIFGKGAADSGRSPPVRG